MIKYDINVILDAHSEGQWISKNLNYFQERCANVSLHWGNCHKKGIEDKWPTIVGETRSDIVTTKILQPGPPKWKPDVIIVDMGTRFGDQGSRISRPKDVFTAIYFADLHRRRSDRFPDGDAGHREYASHYDIAFGRQKWVIESWPNGYWLPHDFHTSWIPKDTITNPEYDICFQGSLSNSDPERIELLNKLSKQFKVYMNGNQLERIDYIRQLYHGKFTFNKTKTDNEINGKVFEMLAAGRLFFTNRVKKHAGLEQLFTNGKHLIIYENFDDLVVKMKYYLEHPDEAKKIAEEGKKEVFAKHHSEKRVEEMLEVIYRNLKHKRRKQR